LNDTKKQNLNAWSRAAKVTDLLWRGQQFTTQEVADLLGVCYTTALRMMAEIARVIPAIQQERYDGHWRLLAADE